MPLRPVVFFLPCLGRWNMLYISWVFFSRVTQIKKTYTGTRTGFSRSAVFRKAGKPLGFFLRVAKKNQKRSGASSRTEERAKRDARFRTEVRKNNLVAVLWRRHEAKTAAFGRAELEQCRNRSSAEKKVERWLKCIRTLKGTPSPGPRARAWSCEVEKIIFLGLSRRRVRVWPGESQFFWVHKAPEYEDFLVLAARRSTKLWALDVHKDSCERARSEWAWLKACLLPRLRAATPEGVGGFERELWLLLSLNSLLCEWQRRATGLRAQWKKGVALE